MQADRIPTFRGATPTQTAKIPEKKTVGKKTDSSPESKSDLSGEVRDRADISEDKKESPGKTRPKKAVTEKPAADTGKAAGKKTPGEKVKAYYDFLDAADQKEKDAKEAEEARKKKGKRPLLPEDMPKGLVPGSLTGLGLEYGIAAAGVSTQLHEQAHAVMVESFYQNPTVTVQVDGIENVKNLINEPNLENFGRMLSAYDINKDGAAGVTRYDYGEGLNETGQSLGKNKVHAMISAAGCVAEEIPALIGFAAGFKLRKKFPATGWTLMTMATVHHLSTSSYVFSALSAASANRPGHDWAKFARVTGIHPVITAIAFGATMPALGVGLWLLEKRSEGKARDRMAVSRLIRNGGISVNELNKSYQNYGKKKKLEKAQERMANVLEHSPEQIKNDKKIQKEFRKALAGLRKEYDRFGNFIADRFRERVNEEKKKLPKPPKTPFKKAISNIKDNIKGAWRKDKIDSVLTTAGLGVAAVVAGKSLVDAVSAATGAAAAGTAGSVVGSLIPGVSLVSTVATTYRAAKTLKSPNAGKMDKAAAVSTAAFSALTSAGLMIPGLGLPAVLAGIGGMLGTQAVKALVNKFA